MCFCDYVCFSIFKRLSVLCNVRLCRFINPLYLFVLCAWCLTLELLEHFIYVCSVYIVFNYRAFGAPGEAGKVTIAHLAQHNTLAAAHVEYMNYEPLILPHSPWNCLLITNIPKWRISLQRVLCSVFSWSTQCTKVCISQVPLDFSPCVDNQNTNLKDKTSSSITGKRSLFLTGDATGLPWRPRLKLEIISCSGAGVPPP